MHCSKLTFVLVLILPGALACSFEFDPVSIQQFYRAEGWRLLGTNVATYGTPSVDSTSGLTAQALQHDESPFVVDFPAQDSVLNGARRRMRAIKAQVNIARWVTHGRTVAYSYSLIPVAAHRADGKWIIDSMAACIFFATFIDDKGDSVFRVLVPD